MPIPILSITKASLDGQFNQYQYNEYPLYLGKEMRVPGKNTRSMVHSRQIEPNQITLISLSESPDRHRAVAAVAVHVRGITSPSLFPNSRVWF